jgi:large subunit ribosomal protein L28
MAKCATCNKVPVVGRNVSHSKRHTPRLFRPNLQKVSVLENGRLVQKTMCAKCIKALSKIK